MAVRLATRMTLFRLTLTSSPEKLQALPNLNFQSFSAVPSRARYSQESQRRKRISLAILLQRYGFPSSQLHSFLSNHNFLLNSNLQEVEESLGILQSFKIPQKSFVSLVIDCPGVLDFEFLKKWEMCFSNLGLSTVPPLMIKSVLQHSRRFQLDPVGVFRSMEVLRGMGFSDHGVIKILEGFPGVMLMNEMEIQRRIEFLVGIGIPRDGIDWVLSYFPLVLGFGVEDRLKPLLSEFKDLGFGEDLIIKEIVQEPRVLGLELGELSRCLELLSTLKCREPIKARIFSDGAFRAGIEVKLRVDYLYSHGLIKREAFGVLWREPRAITYKMEDIEKKIEFLIHRMKFNIHCLVEVPEYLGINFEKQIVPRFNVIEYLRSNCGLRFEMGLRALIKPSRLKFYNLYVKPYPECEKMFGRYLDVEMKSRHPVGLWKHFKPQSFPESKQYVESTKLFMETLL